MRHRLVFSLFGLISIASAFALLNTPIFFTYRSRANQNVINTKNLTQNSTQMVSVNDKLPSCLLQFMYAPTYSCLVQFTCANSPKKTFFTPPRYICAQTERTFICSENPTQNEQECLSAEDWIKGAAVTCGCGSLQ